MQPPKAFLSYCWTSPEHRQVVMDLADRLIKQGRVEVTVDEYDLKEGHDVVAFMEKVSNDQTITHVLVLSDQGYARKADTRKGGVGAETQIISKEVYDSIEQEKFIPIVMEIDEKGRPYLPTFMRNRKYIDFSSLEKINQNWEQLLRLLHGKPMRAKPQLGPMPAFLDEQNTGNFINTRAMVNSLHAALKEGKHGIALYRDELIEAFIEELKGTFGPRSEKLEHADKIAEWESRLRIYPEGRNLLVDWMLWECKVDSEAAVSKCIIPLLEALAKESLGPEGHPDREQIADTIKILGYELSMYAMACLMKVDGVPAIGKLLHYPFVSPKPYDSRPASIGLDNFYFFSRWADQWNSGLQQRWISPVWAKFKENASHSKISFENLTEADALVFVFGVLHDTRWYPASAAFREWGPAFPWFAKANRSSNPNWLATIMDKPSWIIAVSEFVEEAKNRVDEGGWTVFRYTTLHNYLSAMGFVEREKNSH